MSTKIRFYKNEYPEIHEVVMIMVRSVDETINVDLLEYNMSAVVPQSEREDKILYIGDKSPAVALRFNKLDKSLKVSLRGITTTMARECAERFAKAKVINKLLTMVAVRMDLEELYSKTAWYFETKYKRKNAAFEIFQKSVSNPSLLDECNLSELNKGFLLYFINEEFKEPTRRVFAEFECYITSEQDKSAIDIALAAGLNLGTEKLLVSVKALGSKKYRIQADSVSAAEGINVLKDMLQRIRVKLLELNGYFEVTMEPQILRKSETTFEVSNVEPKISI